MILVSIMVIASMAIAETNAPLTKSYSGVGLVIAANPDVQVMLVAKDSPAEKADIHIFDRILRIADRDTKGMTLAEAVSLLKGPDGSTVTILATSITNGTTREITLTRKRFANTSDMTWKEEVLTTYQMPGSTNTRCTIEDRTRAQPPLSLGGDKGKRIR